MGDYGFPGAGEFGGRDENFNCLPDYYYSKCRFFSRRTGVWKDACLKNKKDFTEACSFCGDDYRQCYRYLAEESKAGVNQ